MKSRIAIWLFVCVCMMSGAEAIAARPQVVIGPGTGSVNFRVPWHQTYNRTLSRDTTYILTGWYFVDSTYTITIQSGTLIRGDSASGGSLIVKRGAQIFAQGTANQPIVFTSNKPANRVPGDWGGVIILGDAITNSPTTRQIEGGFGTIPNTDAMFGGSNPNSNSGVLSFVRIEFAGIAFSQDNEINGLTFGGVGAGTTVDHIQVSYANDDDFEWFGGSVNCKYLVGWRSLDDCFDTDNGFSGKMQFLYSKRDPNVFDFSPPGQSNGEESDNEGTSPYTATPRTNARFSNWTLVGPLSDTTNLATLNSHWGYVGMIRRATEISIYNSIMMGWGRGINFRDTLTQRAMIDGRLEFRHISLQAPREVVVLSSSPSTGNIPGFSGVDWFNTVGWGNLGSTPRQTTDIGLPAAVWNLDNSNNPVPSPSSEPATAGTAYDGRLTGEPFFTNVTYRGAFDPSLPMSQQWTAGWTNFAPETYDPELSAASVPVSNGWNIVSLPVASPTPNDSVLSIYTNSTNPFGFAFAGGYVQRYVMAPGLGYWIKSSANYTQNITGTTLNSLTIGLSAGWNMIGSISTSIDTSSVHVTPTPADLRGSNFFRYNNGYLVSATIEPGLGYWVRANGAGSFFMHSTGTTKPLGREQQPVGSGRTIEDLNSITIQDANGGSQTLYFGADGRGEISVDMFAMPPAPPVGSFDARFKSSEGGSMVQTHAEELNDAIDLPIAIQSVAYPLTVSWKVKSGSYELSDGVGGIHPVRGEGTLKIANSAVELIVLKVTGGSNMPREFALSQNYPNPFNPTTSIKYALPVDSRVTMKIYNALGQHVHTLLSEAQPAGYHVAEWNGKNSAGQQLSSGMYFLQLSATGINGKSFNDVRKLMMLK